MHIIVNEQKCVSISKKDQYRICLEVLDNHFKDDVLTTEACGCFSEIYNILLSAQENARITEF